MIRTAFIYVILIGSGFVSRIDDATWHLKKSENGIKVYTRRVEGSNFKELKANFQIKTSLNSLVAFISDFDSYKNWIYRCDYSTILKKKSATELVNYLTIKSIWPVADRDVILFTKIEQDTTTHIITQSSVGIPDFLAIHNHYVRVRYFKSSWTLTPLKEGFVNVEYQLSLDPAGYLPAWLVNMASVDGPYESELKMMKLVFDEKYQSAKINYIKEAPH